MAKMSTLALKIGELLDSDMINSMPQMPPLFKLPVIFNGKEPKVIGFAHTTDEVDAVLRSNRLTAKLISKTRLAGDTREFYICHGA